MDVIFSVVITLSKTVALNSVLLALFYRTSALELIRLM